MNVAVYSGSFNPLHKGHLAILRHLTEVAGYDCVYLIVTPQSPFKDANDTGKERYEAALAALRRHPEVRARALDIELRMDPPHYTVRTLEALQAKEPANRFTLVVGADNLESFPRWKDYGRILREWGIAVFPRKGYHRGHLKARLLREDPSYRIRLLKAPLVTISSTEIREGIAAGRDMSSWLM